MVASSKGHGAFAHGGWKQLAPKDQQSGYLSGEQMLDGGTIELGFVCPKCGWSNAGLEPFEVPPPGASETAAESDHYSDAEIYICGHDGCGQELSASVSSGMGGIMVHPGVPEDLVYWRNLVSNEGPGRGRAPVGYVGASGGSLEFTIVVKAAPERSKKYGETVCTAGVLDDGRMIRVYPVRWIEYGQGRIPRYARVKAQLVPSDEPARRPESHKLVGKFALVDVKLVGPPAPWRERVKLLSPAIDAKGVQGLRDRQKKSGHSLSIVKVKELVDFHIDAAPEDIITAADRRESPQKVLVGSAPKVGFAVDQIKHVFRYTWKCFGTCCGDPKAKGHDMTCEDWELFESFRQWHKKYTDLAKLEWALRNKYFDEMSKKDLHFVLGTPSNPAYQQAPMIIGLVYPPLDGSAKPPTVPTATAKPVFRPPKPPTPKKAPKVAPASGGLDKYF